MGEDGHENAEHPEAIRFELRASTVEPGCLDRPVDPRARIPDEAVEGFVALDEGGCSLAVWSPNRAMVRWNAAKCASALRTCTPSRTSGSPSRL